MFIQLNSLGETVGEVEGESAVIERRFGRMDDAVVRRGEDDDIGGIVIQALCERFDMVRFDHLNGISVANLLARHLAAEVVEQFERVANTAVEFADFAER